MLLFRHEKKTAYGNKGGNNIDAGQMQFTDFPASLIFQLRFQEDVSNMT